MRISRIMTMRHCTYAFLMIISLGKFQSLEIKPESYERNNENCMRLTWDPYFEPDLVTGQPWRIYYTWNMDWRGKCMDMYFKTVTPKILERIQMDMGEYMEQQPNWESATLLVTVGAANHELLLLADQGAAGAFLAVPNVVRDANMSPARKSVPLLKFHIKLVHGARYLIVMDCHVGVSTLSARKDEPPPTTEQIADIAKELNLGVGVPACVKNKDSNELLEYLRNKTVE